MGLWAPDLVEVIVRGNATAQTGGIWKTGTTACSSLAVSFLMLNQKYDLEIKNLPLWQIINQMYFFFLNIIPYKLLLQAGTVEHINEKTNVSSAPFDTKETRVLPQ